jgi:2-oxoisovalerate dehydrogenase E1 component
MDQLINNASKFHHMYGKQFSCNVSLRIPMGGGRGYGPTHSQSLEKFILGIDNIAVFSLSSLVDPFDCIKAASLLKCPKIYIENKIDYSSYLYKPIPELIHENIGGHFGTVRVKPVGARPEVVVIAHGYIARMVADNFEEIFENSDVIFELLAPQLLHPFPFAHFERSIRAANNVLILDDGTQEYGWADGVVAKIATQVKGCSINVVASDPVPIPSKRELEALNLVSKDKVIKGLKYFGGRNV